jgi:transcriptional regulator with XRE-family HTH domain
MTPQQTENPVRTARRRAGLSQFQLAVKAGLHPATISLLERGTRVSEQTATKVAEALGLQPEELRP